jgi:hypothetical protein
VPPDSVVLPLMALTVNPAVSLSVIVTSLVVVAPKTNPDDGLLIVNVAVSSPSTKASSLTVSVAVPVLLPSGIVILVGIVPVKSADVALPVNAKSMV